MKKADYGKAMGKIAFATTGDTGFDNENLLVMNRFPLAMPQEELEKRYFTIQQCIEKRSVLEIEYLSLNNQVSKHLVDPYDLYMYNNAWFVLAFDEQVADFRYFKLNRIQNYIVQPKTFRWLTYYKKSDYLDQYGMKENGDWYHIKLKLSGKYSMLAKERIYGKEQKIQEVDEQTTILSCKMQNKENITKFALGFGDNCEVLEPEWLKEKILSVIENVYNKYK